MGEIWWWGEGEGGLLCYGALVRGLGTAAAGRMAVAEGDDRGADG